MQIDLENVDVREFPDFHDVPYQECILKPGECLYLPPGHWHFVKSLEISFSVTYWWR